MECWGQFSEMQMGFEFIVIFAELLAGKPADEAWITRTDDEGGFCWLCGLWAVLVIFCGVA